MIDCKFLRTAWLPLVALLCVAVPCANAADNAPPTGQVTRTLFATTLVRPLKHKDAGREVLVYTPAGYDDPANAARRYPVLYLLHGSPGHPYDFLRYGAWPTLMEDIGTKALIGAALPILVMPDGNYVGEKHGDSEWANSADGRDRFEDWLTREVVPWTDAHYRTQAQAAGRLIGGVSEGGYGSVNLALRHPDLFGAALACSGYYDNQGAGWARPIMGYNTTFLQANSPLDYVGAAVTAGRVPTAWKGIHFFLGAGDDEKRYYIETRQMAAKMKAAGIPVTLQTPDGKHGWGLWNQFFVNGLTALLARTPAANALSERPSGG